MANIHNIPWLHSCRSLQKNYSPKQYWEISRKASSLYRRKQHAKPNCWLRFFKCEPIQPFFLANLRKYGNRNTFLWIFSIQIYIKKLWDHLCFRKRCVIPNKFIHIKQTWQTSPRINELHRNFLEFSLCLLFLPRRQQAATWGSSSGFEHRNTGRCRRLHEVFFKRNYRVAPILTDHIDSDSGRF